MDKGQVQWVGSSSELADSFYSGFSSQNQIDSLTTERRKHNTNTLADAKENLVLEQDGSGSDEVDEITRAEHRKEGRVEVVVYK